jgi:DNA-binding NarL/FixJ family response regulator
MDAAPLPIPAVPAVLIVTDDPRAHRLAAEVLGAAGFPLVTEPPGSDHPLVVLLHAGTAPERIEAIREAAEARPKDAVIAAMPSEASSSVLRRALRAGADGIVLDGDLARALAPTALAVAEGQLSVPRSLRRQIAPRALSYREKQILGLVVLGYTNRQIADKLYVAESTVKTHLSSAFGKLDTRSRAEAAALIVDPEEGFGLGILSISDSTPAAA